MAHVILEWLTALCRLLASAPCVIVPEVRSICSTSNMPRKCSNSSDAVCYICGEVTFKSQNGLSHPWLRNFMNIISVSKWVIRTRTGLPIFVVWHVTGVSPDWQKFHFYACRHSYCLESADGPCFRLLLLPGQYHWCNRKDQTHCSISKFTFCGKASTLELWVTRAKASNKHDAEWRWVKGWRCRST